MSPKEKNLGSFKRHYSTNSSNLLGVENNKPIVFDSLEQGCEQIKFKYLGVSGVYKLTNKNDPNSFYIGSSNNLARRMEEYNKLTKGLHQDIGFSTLKYSMFNWIITDFYIKIKNKNIKIIPKTVMIN